jgi:long-chain acyl-CoA synthetase
LSSKRQLAFSRHVNIITQKEPATGDTGANKTRDFSSPLARARPGQTGKPAFREKYLGIWQSWTWAQVNDEVRALACGLAALGFQRGMNLAIIGDNRPRLYWSMLAAQCLGGVPVPLYQDAPAADMAYVLENAEIHYAIVEDQEQVDKLLELQTLYPHIATSPTTTSAACATTASKVCCPSPSCRRWAAPGTGPSGFFEAQVAEGRASDNAIILYTSGTTGKPKGVCQTHAALLAAGTAASASKTSPTRKISCPTCRWHGWATACSPSRRR